LSFGFERIASLLPSDERDVRFRNENRAVSVQLARLSQLPVYGSAFLADVFFADLPANRAK
jgi:hypothetical protein